MKKLPKYTKAKMKGNIGESLAQFVLSNFALVHKIDGSNDVGNDFICELVRDESPTNLLFYVQVKYTMDPPRIRPETLAYWRGSPIPVYLFWVRDGLPRHPLNLDFARDYLSYKRYTPFLQRKEVENVNQDFWPFNKLTFLENLLEDYMRTQYAKGLTPILSPRDFLVMDDKVQIGLERYEFRIQNMVPQYAADIIKSGWTNMFSLALALESKGDTQTALSVAKIALELVTAKDRQKYSQVVQQLEQLIQRLPH